MWILLRVYLRCFFTVPLLLHCTSYREFVVSQLSAGLRAATTVWAAHLSDEVRRRFYKNWYRAKKKAFTKYAKSYYGDDKQMSEKIQTEIKRAKDYCQVIRAICHTQVSKAKIGQKKAHICEIQINGGSVAAKVDFATQMFEQQVPVASVFAENEMIDCVGVTKGRGYPAALWMWTDSK